MVNARRQSGSLPPMDSLPGRRYANADWVWRIDAKISTMILTDEPGANSWPITGATWVIMYKKPAVAADSTRTRRPSISSTGRSSQWRQEPMPVSCDYVPMPDNLPVKAIEASWKQIEASWDEKTSPHGSPFVLSEHPFFKEKGRFSAEERPPAKLIWMIGARSPRVAGFALGWSCGASQGFWAMSTEELPLPSASDRAGISYPCSCANMICPSQVANYPLLPFRSPRQSEGSGDTGLGVRGFLQTEECPKPSASPSRLDRPSGTQLS